MTSVESRVGGDDGPSVEDREEGAIVIRCNERGEETGECVGWIGGFSFEDCEAVVPFWKDPFGGVCAVFWKVGVDLLCYGLEKADEDERVFGPADVCLEVVVVPFLALWDERDGRVVVRERGKGGKEC